MTTNSEARKRMEESEVADCRCIGFDHPCSDDGALYHVTVTMGRRSAECVLAALYQSATSDVEEIGRAVANIEVALKALDQ